MAPKRLRLSGWTLMPSAASADRASGGEPREEAMGARQMWRLLGTTEVPPLWIGIVVAAVFIVVETLLVLLAPRG